MKKMLDLKYGQEERLAHSLARLCYWIALSMETKQPASALKLLEASHEAQHALQETFHTIGRRDPARMVARSVRAAKCARAIVRRLQKEGSREAARVTAALEIAERLITMLEPGAEDGQPA